MQPMQPMQPVRPMTPPQPTFTEIKNAAKSSLKHRWPEAIAVSLVFLGTGLLDMVMQAILMTIFKVDAVWSPLSPTSIPLHSTVASVCITVFSAVFSLAIMFPLIFGVMRWFWLVTGGSDPHIGEVFHYFSSGSIFFKSLGISFGLFWRLVLGAVVCFMPYIIIKMLTQSDFYSALGLDMPAFMSGLYPLVTTFELLGFFLLMLWISMYAMFYAVMFSEPGLSAHRTINLGAQMSRGHRMRFIGFMFSFFGWLLLCLLMLPMLFVVPFALASFAVYGREVYRSAHRNPAG